MSAVTIFLLAAIGVNVALIVALGAWRSIRPTETGGGTIPIGPRPGGGTPPIPPRPSRRISQKGAWALFVVLALLIGVLIVRAVFNLL
jgi:hypothetical protein